MLRIVQTAGAASCMLGGCALGVFLSNFYGMNPDWASIMAGLGAFILLASLMRSDDLGSALALVVGPAVLGAGIAWVFGSAGYSPLVFVLGMVLVPIGLIVRIFRFG